MLAVVAWALVVVVCSGGVWGVIRTAGTGVTTSPDLPRTASGTLPSSENESPSPTSSPRPRHHPHPHPKVSRDARPASPDPPTGPSAAPATAPPLSRTAGPGPASHQSETSRPAAGQTTASQDQQPAEVRRTWQGNAGAVVASCRGTTVSLRGAQPNSGWRVEVGNRGPEQIEVQFSTVRDDGGEVELRARCISGEPRFSTNSD